MTVRYELSIQIDHTGARVQLRAYGPGLPFSGQYVHATYDPGGDVRSAIHYMKVNRAAARRRRASAPAR